MIGQLQNPSHGFEDVIKAHFYLKRDRILQVCSYTSLRSLSPCLSSPRLVLQEVEEWVQTSKSSKLERAYQNLCQELKKLEPPPNVANVCNDPQVVICAENSKSPSTCLGPPPKDSTS